MRNIFLLITTCITISASAQKLSPTERKIIDGVNTQLPETFNTLEQLANINSGTMNVKGVRASGELLRAAFEKLAFVVEWISMPDSLKNAGHFVAAKKRRKREKGYCCLHTLMRFLSPTCLQIHTAF